MYSIGSTAEGALANNKDPGLRDSGYLKRKREIMRLSALNYSLERDNIQEIEYNKEEKEIWKRAFERLMWVQENWAESSIKKMFFEKLAPANKLSENEIPQLKQQSQVHLKHSGWRLRPCTGFLTLQDYLKNLAFKMYPAT